MESGERPVSRKAFKKIEAIYGISLRRYSTGVGRPGRPQYWAVTKEAMRKISRGVQELWSKGAVKAPLYSQPHQVDLKGDPLWPMALHLGEEAGAEVQRLEELRANDDFFWRQFKYTALRFVEREAPVGSGRFAGRTVTGSSIGPIGMLANDD